MSTLNVYVMPLEPKKRALDSPGIGIRVIANNHSGAWNPPPVFCKSNKPSLQY